MKNSFKGYIVVNESGNIDYNSLRESESEVEEYMADADLTDSEFAIKPVNVNLNNDAYAMTMSNGEVINSSIRDTEELCKNDYCERYAVPYEHFVGLGYSCVPVCVSLTASPLSV